MHYFDWLMFWNYIIGTPIFKLKMCYDNPGTLRKLKKFCWKLHNFIMVNHCQWINRSLFHLWFCLEWCSSCSVGTSKCIATRIAFPFIMHIINNLFWCFEKPWLLILLMNHDVAGIRWERDFYIFFSGFVGCVVPILNNSLENMSAVGSVRSWNLILVDNCIFLTVQQKVEYIVYSISDTCQ